MIPSSMFQMMIDFVPAGGYPRAGPVGKGRRRPLTVKYGRAAVCDFLAGQQRPDLAGVVPNAV